MARFPRVVVPGLPHHVTQRGNRRQRVFFEEGDYSYYLRLVRDAARASETTVWAYCLMPNHVHFIVAPKDEGGLRATFGEAHRKYTSILNSRHGWTGHLWQGRFSSCAMDERHALAAIRYVAMNPVRARLVERAAQWRWSSAGAHLRGRSDGVIDPAPVLERTGDFSAFLAAAEDTDAIGAIRRTYATGRPAGSDAWLAALSAQLGRDVTRSRPGPKRVEVPVTVY